MPEEVNQNPTNFKVFVAIPAHEGATKVPCTIGLLHLQQVFFLNNIPYEIKFETGCPYISMARNNLIAKFMQSDCTDLLFIDDDVGFPLEAVSKIFNYDVDVIAGIYPKRKEPIEWPVILKVADGKIAIENGIVEAENLPTGFMRIKREVIQKMQAQYPELEYIDANGGEKRFNLFGLYIKDNRFYGDDYGFCHLWTEMGGKTWAIPDIDFIHYGAKSFEGNFHTYIMKEAGRLDGAMKAAQIDGFMARDELEWLHSQALKSDSIIELGSWKGRSTIALLEGCKGSVTAIDNWQGHDPASNGVLERLAKDEDVFSTFMENVKGYSNLRVIKADTEDAAHNVAYDIQPADMVFIDAEHTYDGCKKDIKNWLPKAKKVIAGHDYCDSWPGVVQAVNEAFGQVNVAGTIWYKEIAP